MIEYHKLCGRTIEVHREDLRVGAPYRPHGKTPSIIKLMSHIGNSHASCFASRGSDWALNAAIAAADCGIEFTIYTQLPSKTLPEPDFIAIAREQYHAHIEHVRANHTMIMSAQARNLAEARGDFFIPFGLELPIVMDELTERLRNFNNAATVIVVAGSGITMCCLLKAALLNRKRFADVRGISSGRPLKSICKTLQRYISPIEMSQVTRCSQLVDTGSYGASSVESAWHTHPFYERKAYAWLLKNIDSLEEPICFLNM
jgi:hypothetical protein